MRLQPTHDMSAVGRARYTTTAIHETGIEQLDQGGEVWIVAIMRCRSQQQQPVAASRYYLRQPSAQCVVAIRARGGADAVMRLVDDRQIPRRALEFLQHPLLLREVERGQA